MTMLTVEQLAALPLYDRAYYGLYGQLPDGTRVMRPWQSPDLPVVVYVETLQEAMQEFTAETQLSLVRPGRLREWKERFAALEGDKP